MPSGQLTEGGVVGVGGAGQPYSEFRVLTVGGPTFGDAATIKEQIWPHIGRAVLGADGGSPTIGVETAYYNNFAVGAAPAPRFEGDEYATSVLPAASTDDAATKTAAWATGREVTHYIAIDNGGTLEWTPNSSQAEGLRGTPVADNAALTALAARDYERRKVLASGEEYVFTFGAATGTLADDAGTGFWSEQTPAVQDAPAEYDRLFGNIANPGISATDTFVPTQTGTYEFINELGTTTNEVAANFGTTVNGADLVNNNATRLSGSRKRTLAEVALTAGTTYHIAAWAGGSTGNSSIRVVIRLKDYVQKTVIRPEDAVVTGLQREIFSQSVGGGVPATVTNLADIGVTLQNGDEIRLQLDIGSIHAIWVGSSAIAGAFHGVTNNRVTFTQVGTTLRFQGANTNGTLRWLKIIRAES